MALWKYKYFVDVVENKSFTKAGKKNFISQTAISQQISALEKNIGEKLLIRGSGEVKLTEFGKIVYDNACAMLDIHDEMMRTIKQLKEGAILKIGIDNSINNVFWKNMQDIIDTYYSEKDFQFLKLPLERASTLIAQDELDLYIGYSSPCQDDRFHVEETLICENPISVYVSNSCELKDQSEISLKDLNSYARYASDSYPCSVVPDIPATMYCSESQLIGNLDTSKIKVELNNGYMFVDGLYFSYSEGTIIPVNDLQKTCELKAFYKENTSAINRFLLIMNKVLLDSASNGSL